MLTVFFPAELFRFKDIKDPRFLKDFAGVVDPLVDTPEVVGYGGPEKLVPAIPVSIKLLSYFLGENITHK